MLRPEITQSSFYSLLVPIRNTAVANRKVTVSIFPITGMF